MEYSHSFEQCYKLLDIPSNANWSELKQSYRKLIHKWHPDRYPDEKEKTDATNKLQDLNTAYTQLSDYYRANGSLPLTVKLTHSTKQNEEITINTVKQTEQPEERKLNSAPLNKNRQINTSHKKNKTFSRLMVVISLFTIVFIGSEYLDIAIESFTDQINQPSHEHNNAITTQKHTTNKKEKTNFKKKITVKDKFFTYDSTIFDVISAQGPPDRTEGDIWYYGKSEIHFNEGKVRYWVRSKNTPLKALMKKPLEKTYNKPTNNIQY